MYSKYIALSIALVGIMYPLVAIALGDTDDVAPAVEDPVVQVAIAEDLPVKVVPVIVTPPKVVQKNNESPRYDSLVRKYADQYGVSYGIMNGIISCENYSRDPTLQSQLYYSFTNSKLGIYKNQQELSVGISQINLHYNPKVSLEQAQDPDFSIEFMAKALANGNHSWWSTYTNGCYKKHM